ncbi:hypothetical protein EO244_07995 [Ancylomarina salipaludis]|uniref:DUF5689 domain-containing protein n=1 Tax=Ancylomarina salipaludis TaxID=2501299 RepID=A0A4Q1JLQ1_9BACT|nr:DUF5689 domain-containing protein [Ancylomarina salipaludis]RXQ94984.1 hypothetical protein EO244_07995 [Ancylomarina salipaludis]
MKKLHYLLFVMVMGLAVSFTSCSSDNDSPIDPSPVDPTPELPVANKTIADLRALTTGDAVEVPADFIFKGIVVSNQAESNNFYQAIYLQDGDVAVKISCLKEGDKFYQTFVAGQEVFVKAAGLFMAKYYDTYTLGYQATDDKYKVSRIPEVNLKAVAFGGELNKNITPKEIDDLSTLTPDMVGTLVKVNNVQVVETDKGKKLGDKDNSGYTTIGFTTIDKKTIAISNSNYANFNEEVVPEGSGSISGILNTFGADFQIALTGIDGLELTGERFTVESDNNGGDTGVDDGDNGLGLFPGSDFETWETFTGALNQYGLKDYAVQSDNGRDGSKALYINTTPTGNDYVFTATVPENFDATGKTKIIFYIKGTSGKSLSLNVYTTDGFKPFNLGDYSTAATVEPAGSNSYTGAIDTAGEWLKVTLNIADLALATEAGSSLFALKVGKTVAYDLLIDDITIK